MIGLEVLLQAFSRELRTIAVGKCHLAGVREVNSLKFAEVGIQHHQTLSTPRGCARLLSLDKAPCLPRRPLDR
jgi:hypothetical protein